MKTTLDNARYMQIAMRIERRKFNDNHGIGGRFASDDMTEQFRSTLADPGRSVIAVQLLEHDSTPATLQHIPTQQWEASLSPKQKSTVNNYAEGSAFVVNSYLRSGVMPGEKEITGVPEKYIPSDMQAYTKNLDAALALPDAVTHTDMTVYRGFGGYSVGGDATSGGSTEAAWEQMKNSVGKTFTDNGYVSTSLSRVAVHEFIGDKGILAAIDVPAESRGAFLEYGSFANAQERQWLMPRGATFSVEKVLPDMRNGVHRIRLLYQGSSSTPLPKIKGAKVQSTKMPKRAALYIWAPDDIVWGKS